MYVGQNNILVPYKIDTGSDANIMPEHVFKKLSPKVTDKQLAKTKTSTYYYKHIIKPQ